MADVSALNSRMTPTSPLVAVAIDSSVSPSFTVQRIPVTGGMTIVEPTFNWFLEVSLLAHQSVDMLTWKRVAMPVSVSPDWTTYCVTSERSRFGSEPLTATGLRSVPSGR